MVLYNVGLTMNFYRSMISMVYNLVLGLNVLLNHIHVSPGKPAARSVHVPWRHFWQCHLLPREMKHWHTGGAPPPNSPFASHPKRILSKLLTNRDRPRGRHMGCLLPSKLQAFEQIKAFLMSSLRVKVTTPQPPITTSPLSFMQRPCSAAARYCSDSTFEASVWGRSHTRKLTQTENHWLVEETCQNHRFHVSDTGEAC